MSVHLLAEYFRCAPILHNSRSQRLCGAYTYVQLRPVSHNHCTGIGPVLNLRFSPSFSTITWDPPSTVGVLSNLTYHLTVTNMNTGVVIINTTTTDTSYPLSSLQLCTLYSASVAAVSPEYSGDTVVIVGKTHGGDYYRLIIIIIQ